MKVGYYPGCSLHSTAKAYDASTQAVCGALAVELVEIPDWNCCGSTPAHVADHFLSLALPARNLALAEKSGLREVTAPCAACFNHLKRAEVEFNQDKLMAKKIKEAIEMDYRGSTRVRNLLDLLVNGVGLEEIWQKVKKPLKGLKVVPYYGCLLTRPNNVTQFDHPTNPQTMDRLMATLGAEVLSWGAKTECCGASYALAKTEVVYRLSGNILEQARAVGADAIVTACPLCQSNLDVRQPAIEKQVGHSLNLPVFFFTELLGLALGVDAGQLGLKRHLVSPMGKLAKKGLI